MGKSFFPDEICFVEQAAYIKMLLISNILSLKPLPNSCMYILRESGLEVLHVSV